MIDFGWLKSWFRPRGISEKAEWRGWMFALFVVMLLGVTGVVVYAASIKPPGNAGAVGSIGFLLAGGCLLLGGLVGFLFGIPRSLQQNEDTMRETADSGAGSTPSSPRIRYGVNTNLEQISDWLTKILVGVGLTQMGKIPGLLREGAEYLDGALGGSPYGEPIALWIILYFSSCGFLFSYLWTRLFLTRALAEADMGAIIATVQRVQIDQTQIDAEALSLAYRYLNPETKPEDINIAELKRTIRDAAASIKVQIFYRAEEVRSENWDKDVPLMARTIPIFEALVESDTEQRFHRNFGQLGFALKDQRKPDFKKAEEMLTKAIEIRGPAEKGGWLFYEANRAICRIQLDSNFAQGQPSAPEIKEVILKDLRAAHGDDYTQERIIESSEPIQQWMSLNEVTL